MPTTDQKVNPERYQIIPRVLVFVMQHNSVLLLKILPRNGKTNSWTGRYNGAGGHVEWGEDVISASRRELLEETGLTADISLCGSVIVDSGQNPGIGLFIMLATNPAGELRASDEGEPKWIPLGNIQEYPLVEDVAVFLERIGRMKPGDPPFAGRSYYDANGSLVVSIE